MIGKIIMLAVIVIVLFFIFGDPVLTAINWVLDFLKMIFNFIGDFFSGRAVFQKGGAM